MSDLRDPTFRCGDCGLPFVESRELLGHLVAQHPERVERLPFGLSGGPPPVWGRYRAQRPPRVR